MDASHYTSETYTPPPPNDVVTEDGAALQFAELYCGKLLFDHDVGKWFAWTGTHWKREETGLAFDWARALARRIGCDEKAGARRTTSKASFAAGVERFAKADRAFAITSEAWDLDPLLLGTPGGTIDLRTGLLRAPDPADRITKVTAAAPANEPRCPRWKRFIGEAMGEDGEVVRFLQQWAGYCLTGSVREHTLAFGYGSGGNGKSVYINVHAGVLGDYAVTAPMDTFTASFGDKHPTDLAMLRGARFVSAVETEEGRAWAESRIKAITGGDKISARFMRQDFFEFAPTFKLAIVGNHRPVLRTVDDAVRRRFAIIPFTRKPAVPDRDLEAKLRAEWPGILRWMIDGCLDWQRHGLVRPPAVCAATDGYFADQDVFQQWLDDECDVEIGNTWKCGMSGELYSAWAKYATDAGEKPGTQKAFGEAMQKRGLEKHRGTGGVRQWRGLRLKMAAEHGAGRE